MELLKVENLKKSFKKRGQIINVLDNVSFTLDEGECLGLVGESGCGKSTTVNILARLVKEDEGSIYFKGRRINNGGKPEIIGKELQMVFQNPQESFDPRDNVIQGIMQGAESYKIYSKEQLKIKAEQLLKYVGLKEDCKYKKTWQLSGGECQRVAIARALICNPDLLICDEATSSLDVLVQAQIIDLLKKLKKDNNMSMIFITHDLPLASVICDRIAVMDKGKIIEIKEGN